VTGSTGGLKTRQAWELLAEDMSREIARITGADTDNFKSEAKIHFVVFVFESL
jgi:hypothetical protein